MNNRSATDVQIDAIASLASEILIRNPAILDTIIDTLYGVVENLESLQSNKMLSHGRYIPPHRLKHPIVKRAISKIGYSIEDIPNLCRQGRGDEILQEIDRLEKSSTVSTSSPSRRLLPITNRISNRNRFEEIHDGK